MIKALFVGALLTVAASPAVAQSAWTLNGTVGVISDYRYRGYSLSDGTPAAQAGLRASHSVGFYGDVYLSSIEEYGVGDDGDGANLEVTGSLGWAGAISGFDVNAAVSAYRYPDGDNVNYFEVPVQVGKTVNGLTWTLGLAYAPPQSALAQDDNSYGWAALEYAPADWPVALSGTLGYEKGAFASDGKIDWSATAQHDIGPVVLTFSWIDSDADDGALVVSAFVNF